MLTLDSYNSTRTSVNGLGLSKLLPRAFDQLVKDKRINKNALWRVEVSFVGTKAITQLSSHYYKTPRETDVISLSYFEELHKTRKGKNVLNGDHGVVENSKKGDAGAPLPLAGEIFISVPYAFRQAKKIGQSLNEELRFLFVHGLLHVFGYDHLKPKEEKHMLNLTYTILGRTPSLN